VAFKASSSTKDVEPGSGNPRPERTVLIIAKLKFFSPGIGFEEIVMQRPIGVQDGLSGRPRQKKEKESCGRDQVFRRGLDPKRALDKTPAPRRTALEHYDESQIYP